MNRLSFRRPLTHAAALLASLLLLATPSWALTQKEAESLAQNLVTLFTTGDAAAADAAVDPMVRMRSPVLPREAVGIQNLKAFAQTNKVSFPDLAIDIEEVMVQGETMIVRFQISGTNTGPLGQLPPTGRAFSVPGVAIALVEDGKIVDWQDYWNAVEMYASLGFTLVPPRPAAPTQGR